MWQNNASDWNGPKTRQAHARRLGFADPAQEVLEGAAWEMVKNAWGALYPGIIVSAPLFFYSDPLPLPIHYPKSAPP